MVDRRSDISSRQGSSGWHIALERASSDAKGDKVYLGDIEAVGGLVRVFVSGICERYGEVGSGAMSRDEAADADAAACRRLADIFSGKPVEGYVTVGEAWNGAGLAKHIRLMLDGYLVDEAQTDDHAAIEQAFGVLTHQVYQAIVKFEDDGDEDDLRLSLEALADDWSHMMLGIVPTDPVEDSLDDA